MFGFNLSLHFGSLHMYKYQRIQIKKFLIETEQFGTIEIFSIKTMKRIKQNAEPKSKQTVNHQEKIKTYKNRAYPFDFEVSSLFLHAHRVILLCLKLFGFGFASACGLL